MCLCLVRDVGDDHYYSSDWTIMAPFRDSHQADDWPQCVFVLFNRTGTLWPNVMRSGRIQAQSVCQRTSWARLGRGGLRVGGSNSSRLVASLHFFKIIFSFSSRLRHNDVLDALSPSGVLLVATPSVQIQMSQRQDRDIKCRAECRSCLYI